MDVRLATSADALGIARVHVASWQTTYAELLPAAYIAERTLEQRYKQATQVLADPLKRTVVAIHSAHTVVGFASGGASRSHQDRYNGELYALYLLIDYQRRGIGSKIVRALGDALIQQNRSSMLTWVLAANPARFFYEALGGQRIDTKVEQMGDHWVNEIAFGWNDIRSLATATVDH